MIALSRYPAFRPWRDPRSGVESLLLHERVAPVQQHFYYTNQSISADGRWLWFYASFPPNPQRTLAVCSLDPARPLLRHFPQAAPSDNSAMVAPRGDACWFCCGSEVLEVGIDGGIRRIAALPADWLGGRHLWRLATHLTLSSDGRHLALDGHAGESWFLALADVHDGSVRVVKEFLSNHNHAQFSRHDPGLLLIAHDQFRHPFSGRFIHHDLRVHIMRSDGGGYRCLTPQIPCRPYHGACHEWWTEAGTVAYIDYDSGVWEVDPADGVHHQRWAEPLCHAHCDAARRYWVADQSPYQWPAHPCRVILRDAQRGQTVDIASALPPPVASRGLYHIDPHPQLTPDGGICCYTSTALDGQVDVALCPVAEAAARIAS
jgi:hypothetical protein